MAPTRALLLAAALLSAVAACDGAGPAAPHGGADPERGRAAVVRYRCGTCHAIPGIRGARATVGPPLDRIGVRAYAGGLPNTLENLAAFLRDPRAVRPGSPMPAVGLSEEEARDVAAFLRTLR